MGSFSFSVTPLRILVCVDGAFNLKSSTVGGNPSLAVTASVGLMLLDTLCCPNLGVGASSLWVFGPVAICVVFAFIEMPCNACHEVTLGHDDSDPVASSVRPPPGPHESSRSLFVGLKVLCGGPIFGPLDDGTGASSGACGRMRTAADHWRNGSEEVNIVRKH